jgi:DNA-binding response OmpR family regulator
MLPICLLRAEARESILLDYWSLDEDDPGYDSLTNLDWELPGSTMGTALMRALRTIENVPPVVVSAASWARSEALEEGAADFVLKRFSAGDLLHRVAAQLRSAQEAHRLGLILGDEQVVRAPVEATRL